MVWEPSARLDVLKVTVLRPAVVISGPWPMLVEPSKKITVPLGLAAAVLPGGVTDTVAVKVAGCPAEDELDKELTTVLVAALLIACPPVRVPPLPVKLPSPL